MNAEQIQRIRSRLGLTQDAFAKRLNVSVRTIKRWENDEVRPHKSFIKAIEELR